MLILFHSFPYNLELPDKLATVWDIMKEKDIYNNNDIGIIGGEKKGSITCESINYAIYDYEYYLTYKHEGKSFLNLI